MGSLVRLKPPDRAEPRVGSLEELGDEELMARVRSDERAAFRVIVVRHAAKVASFCARISGDPAGAREIAQGVWLALWDARRRWEPRARFASFLYAIAFSRARNHARSRRRSAGVFAPVVLADDRVIDASPTGLDRVILAERRGRLQDALDALPAPMREALVLRFVEDLSYEEMEEIQGVPSSTLRSRVHHALARLRVTLEEVP